MVQIVAFCNIASILGPNLGFHRHAKAALEQALLLAPNSRFVVRSAARFHVHTREPETALAILRSHPHLDRDPWLLSAEIAISSIAGRPSKVAKRARDAVEAKRFSPAQVTEVASALASMELEHGNTKRSKKLFDLSLKFPTDNTVAQAEWASREAHIELLEPRHLQIARTFEARAFELFESGHFSDAYNNSVAWLIDEPFSTRPVRLGSFVASVALEDFDASIRVARAGAAANPTDQAVKNSLIYALIMAGRLEEAEKELATVDIGKADDSSKVSSLATSGLLRFRAGDHSTGRNMYEKAMALAESLSMSALAATACAYWAREENPFRHSRSG